MPCTSRSEVSQNAELVFSDSLLPFWWSQASLPILTSDPWRHAGAHWIFSLLGTVLSAQQSVVTWWYFRLLDTQASETIILVNKNLFRLSKQKLIK